LLRSARQKQLWSAKVIDFLVQAAEDDMAVPRRQDSLAAWFKPRLAAVLRAEQVRNLGELMALIAVRGAGWWRPVPRIGAGKAARLEAWLGQHAASLGALQRQPLPVLQRRTGAPVTGHLPAGADRTCLTTVRAGRP
jgi:hypothetical protein